VPIFGAGESLRSATEGAVTAPYARDGTLSEERSLSDNKSSHGPSSEGTVPVQPAPDLLLTTPLHELHVELGAKMVPFAGYDMPVQYPLGIMKEHLHTRACVGLFDVSHMGQVRLTGDNPAAALETLVPGEIQALPQGRMRYSLFTNEQGGILDDLMITNMGDHLFLVVNAGCKAADVEHLRTRLAGKAKVEYLGDRALLALQGPMAAEVLSRFVPAAETMKFMSVLEANFRGVPVLITRSGYTGEDGYEISVPNVCADITARLLLAEEEVEAIGLGARDSLRLEAGLCLYGHDIDTTTTPVEANLNWVIGKRRRAEGGFPGADIILDQLANGTARKRVGIRPDGRAPAREHTPVTDESGAALGEVTSGGFGPSVNGPVAMGYVATAAAVPGTPVNLVVRGKPIPAKIAEMPFVPQRYYRG
jgi:aminomethyltransferase